MSKQEESGIVGPGLAEDGAELFDDPGMVPQEIRRAHERSIESHTAAMGLARFVEALRLEPVVDRVAKFVDKHPVITLGGAGTVGLASGAAISSIKNRH